VRGTELESSPKPANNLTSLFASHNPENKNLKIRIRREKKKEGEKGKMLDVTHLS